MEITKEQIIDAFKETPALVTDILPSITESEAVKTMVTNKANLIFNEKIKDEVSNVHKRYDQDMFDILGVKPEDRQDGTRQKTYEKIKEIYGDYKTLKEKKGSLDKDQAVIDLKAQIETLRKEGGGKHIQAVFDQAKLSWAQEKQDLLSQVKTAQTDNISFKKSSVIGSALAQIKFNPDTPESLRNMAMTAAKNQLIKNSKYEGDKLIFLNAEGKPILNSQYEAKSAVEILNDMDIIKDVSLKTPAPGGGADVKIKGKIETRTVEGNDEKRLILQEGSFKTRLEFNQVATKALLDEGITKSDKDWTQLMDKAYKEYKVRELPRT